MSDTSGANLEGDMPGLGTAPPQTGVARSPLQLPSALQGLAGLFKQQPQRPRFQPPKPPAITEEQARQPPQHTGKPASFAPVPATVPVPTGGFTPYIKTADRRDFDQWGDQARFPRLPATFELPHMFGDIGKYFAQAGGDVGEAGVDLSKQSLAFQEGFYWAQDQKMKRAREGMALASAKLEQGITNRLIDYANTFSAYRAAGGENAVLNGVDLYHAQWQNALKDDDTNAIAMFEAGRPLKEIEAYMAEADKNLRDLQAARTKAADQEAEDAAAVGVGPLAGGAGAGGGGSGKFNALPPAQTDPTQPAPKTPTDDTTQPDWAQKDHVDPTVVANAEDRFVGAPADPHSNKYIDRAGEKYKAVMDTEVNKILDDAKAGRIKPDEVIPAVRKALGPRIADQAEQVLNYGQPGFGSGFGTGGSQRQAEYGRILDDIAHAANPGDKDGVGGFNPTYYKEQDAFRKDPSIRLVQDRINALPADADEVRRDVFILKDKGYDMNSLNWQGIKDGLLAGNTDFQKIRSDMMAYATAFQTIIGGGKTTLGGTRDVEENFPPQAPLATYFSVMKGHMGDVRGQVHAKHIDWEARGGKPDNMPRGDKGTERQIDDYWRMDAKTGAMPYDPANPDNDFIRKPKGDWGPAGEYYWTGVDQIHRDNPKNWKRVTNAPNP